MKDREYEIVDTYRYDFKEYNPDIRSVFVIGQDDTKIFVDLITPNERYKEITAENDDGSHINLIDSSDTFEIGYVDWNDKSYHKLKELKDRRVRVCGIAYHNGNYLYRTISIDTDINGKYDIKTYYVKDGQETELEAGKSHVLIYFPRFTRLGNKVAFYTPNVIGKGKTSYVNLFDLETGNNTILKEYLSDTEYIKGEELFVRLTFQKGKDTINYTTFKDYIHTVYQIHPETQEVTTIKSIPRTAEVYDTDDFQFVKYLDEQDIWRYAFVYKNTTKDMEYKGGGN